MTRRKPRKPRKPEPVPPPDWQWWLLAVAVPLVICASKLNLDLWYDEAFTLEYFVSQPLLQIAADYSAANNHVFYSLLLRPVYLISDSEFALRLPSLLFTAGTLLMVFRLGRRWGGIPTAVSATLWLGLTQMFLIHTMQVRGYGLSMFLAAWLGYLAFSDRQENDWRRPAAIALVGAGFLYVMPTNVLLLAPLALAGTVWTAVGQTKRGGILIEAAAWAAACCLAGLLYWPIVDQVLRAGGDRAAVSVFSVLDLCRRVCWAAFHDWLPVVPVAVAGLVIWGRQVFRKAGKTASDGSAQASSPQDGAPGWLLPTAPLVLLLGPFVLTALVRISPFPRNYCVLLPFAALAMGRLLAECIQAAGRFFSAKWTEEATALVGIVLLAGVALPSLWTYPARLAEVRRQRFAQDGYYNYYAADFHPSRVVAYLRQSIEPQTPYRIHFENSHHFPLGHYFRRAGMPLERVDTGSISASRPVVYVIAPELADHGELTLVKGFGYYQLYQAP